ncbi:MAG: hypothetical protein JWO32_898 [Bacteroidetes bacterium]|nr:hypothetical protein [Bacteroidota bacterium]
MLKLFFFNDVNGIKDKSLFLVVITVFLLQ